MSTNERAMLLNDQAGAICRFCGLPWKQTVRLLTGNNLNAAVPVCNAHASAVQKGDWALTIRCGDMVRTLQGGDDASDFWRKTH